MCTFLPVICHKLKRKTKFRLGAPESANTNLPRGTCCLVFCPRLSVLPKANVGGVPCGSNGGLDAQDSAKWQRLFSMSGAWKLGSFYNNQNPPKVSVQIPRPLLLSSPPTPPHPTIFTIMHMHCHKSNALSWSVGAKYIKRARRICIQTYLF